LAFIVRAPEITGKRLFAYDMFASLNGIDDHRRMQCRRRADIDDINLAIVEKVSEISIRFADIMLLGEVEDMIAARGHGRHLGVKA
jgi:hypothetical protein